MPNKTINAGIRSLRFSESAPRAVIIRKIGEKMAKALGENVNEKEPADDIIKSGIRKIVAKNKFFIKPFKNINSVRRAVSDKNKKIGVGSFG